MIRVKVLGSSFMLCLGPGPPSLLHLTRANAEKPYAGDTTLYCMGCDGAKQILEVLELTFSNMQITPSFPDTLF